MPTFEIIRNAVSYNLTARYLAVHLDDNGAFESVHAQAGLEGMEGERMYDGSLTVAEATATLTAAGLTPASYAQGTRALIEAALQKKYNNA